MSHGEVAPAKPDPSNTQHSDPQQRAAKKQILGSHFLRCEAKTELTGASAVVHAPAMASQEALHSGVLLLNASLKFSEDFLAHETQQRLIF